jgi:hypothetical protein
MSESIGLYRVTNPGKPGSNHLLPIALGTIHLSFCETPDGMSFIARRQPRTVKLAGVFTLGFPVSRAALSLLHQQSDEIFEQGIDVFPVAFKTQGL